ncbi:tRNA lysidine(34) synthetase TilS [Poseidonocella sedimentorum]|uniref:tRNA(Ile)-lysidine synthase n=1 Tax=Poseidonocella sedimentorum TaxID=871652 RepID=A0A1I6EFG6_9RHOB|nr:tRNA lysidine(34) synthetase TilS [Poseidonocella sedimentorum]SFR16474.1 tRNA(Ile)-lysidine synthase [Poseidonocella sedimentorum]
MTEARPALCDHVARSVDTEGITRLGVAVSGGGDSMALLDLARHAAHARGAPLPVALSIDHGLRAEVAAELALVAAYCARHGIVHRIARWEGQAATGNLQASARRARYRRLAELARAEGLDAVALAHTQDDQAETLLMRLARASGSDGLRAMRAVFDREGARFLRPLLTTSRAALRAHLRGEGIDWAEDPSNEDRRFDRVRARQALAALGPLGLDAEALARVARILADENDVLRRLTAEAGSGLVEARAGALCAPVIGMAELDPELRRRVLHRMIDWLSGPGYPPRADALHRFAEAALNGETRTLAGVVAFTIGPTLWLARETAALPPPGPVGAAWDGRWRLVGSAPTGAALGALGETGLRQIPDWRALGLPRSVLAATPALWQGETLVAAPLARAPNGFEVKFDGTDWKTFLATH